MKGKRIWAVPALTAVIFVITASTAITFSARTSSAISSLEVVSFPYLDGNTHFSAQLEDLISVFQGAVAEGDLKRLEEASGRISKMDN